MKIVEKERVNKNPVHVKLHSLWRSMIGRCYQEKNGSYKNYGAKGVTVVASWRSYEGFLSTIDTVEGFDIDKLIKGELQLDKDIKGDSTLYSPETCKFVTPKENYSNRKNNREFIAINLKTEEVVILKNREQFCLDHKLDSSSLWRILQKNAGKPSKHKTGTSYKNWVVYYTEDFSMSKLPEVKRYRATSISTGEIEDFTNKSAFARRKGVNITSVSAVLAGRQNRVGDWELKELAPIHYKDSTTIERQLIAYGVIRTNQVE